MCSREDRTINDIAAGSGEDDPLAGSVSWRAAVAAISGLAAAWIAAGSTGLLGHPLRHALTWACLAIAVCAVWPEGERRWTRRAAILAGAALAVALTASQLPAVNVLAVAILLAVLAACRRDDGRPVIRLASRAAAVFAIYRLAYAGIPLVWIGADSLGAALGRLAGAIAGEPLRIGATFGGVDFLVLMAALYAGWLFQAPPPRRTRILYGAAAIIGGHLIYLIVLAYAPKLLLALPDAPAGKNWTWISAVRSLLPWNLPLLALAIHSAIAATMFRWSSWPASAGAVPAQARRSRWIAIACAVTAALALPALTTLWFVKPDMKGKKIVFYEKGFLNWLKPKHGEYGRLSVGMYGMMPEYIESLGAKCLISPDLSEPDLRDADVLVILFPDKPWQPGQLERIWSFVRRGGRLLLFADHTTRDRDGTSRFNDVLAPTAMQVRFDCAEFTVGGWLQSYEALAHPSTVGIRDERNQFGVVIGASVEAEWPARPLLVGRWGWNDAGDEGATEQAMIGNLRYDPGERLGDILLAAEQPFGAGKVIVFGDTSSMVNGITVGSHVFTSRLFGYVADGPRDPRALWRQLLAIAAALVVVASLRWPADERWVIAVAGALAASLLICTAVSYRAAQVLPDGRGKSPNNLAYVDASHIESYSEESWRPDGIGGLHQTLMRNGFLTLMLPEFTAERLERAGLLISVAPHRAFSKSERKVLRDFVEKGGTFLITAGHQEWGASKSLLSEYGFECAAGPAELEQGIQEARPRGHFKSPYLNLGGRLAYVRFHAAWPIRCSDPGARIIAYGNKDEPVILLRRIGAGKVVVIGDTCFAMNVNLENEGGEPFEGMRENADFWRWLLSDLRGGEVWLPTAPPAASGSPAR